MVIIDFFVLNLNPISASLKSLSIFVNSRTKVNFKINYDFSTNEAWGTSVQSASFHAESKYTFDYVTRLQNQKAEL